MDVFLLALLTTLNALFAMSEMALSTSRRARLAALAETGDAGIPRSRIELRQERRLDELPRECMLTTTGSDEEDAHDASLLRRRGVQAPRRLDVDWGCGSGGPAPPPSTSSL